jgi:hypothetical protein
LHEPSAPSDLDGDVRAARASGGLLLLRLPSGEDGGKMRVSFVEIEVF